MKEEQFNYTKEIIRIPVITIVLMWFVYWVEIKFDYNFTSFGVFPRDLKGLRGVLFSPFIHGGIGHLFNNTIPVFVFLMMLFYFYKEIALKVLIYGSLLAGILTWIIGVKAYHIGMSGIVYLLFSFIFFSGILRKHYKLIAVSLVVIFLYGGMFWYVFPIKKGISWEGHLSGLMVGFIFSIIYKNKGPQKKAYEYSVDEFDLMFDENGNFSPPQVEEEEGDSED